MVKWPIRIVVLLVVIAGGLFWWLMLSGSKAPAQAPGVIDIAAVRALADAPADQRATAVRIIETGHDRAPNFAIVAGRFGGDSAMSYNSVELELPDRRIVLGGAVDAATAEAMQQTPQAAFSQANYDALLSAINAADQVLITHEHLDHVMAVARHPAPGTIAQSLRLNPPQFEAMSLFQNADQTAAWETAGLNAALAFELQAIAPGVVIIPSAGHTAGSQMVYVHTASDHELLFIGDIAWNLAAIEALTTRPILTQYVVFEPNEQRDAVKAQLRALYDLAAAEPDIAIIPSHDRENLAALEADGRITFIEAE
ncbi:MAG: hypothetical protein AAFR33_12945 [Pseudomonadota bacterium]